MLILLITVAAELNSPSDDYLPTLSADRLTVYLASTRVAPGAKGGFDVWMSHRSTINDGFPTPTLVDELNTAGDDYSSWLSVDNCWMYGMSNSGGVNRFLWRRGSRDRDIDFSLPITYHLSERQFTHAKGRGGLGVARDRFGESAIQALTQHR